MKADFFISIKQALSPIGKLSVWNTGLLNETDRLGRFPLLFLEFTGINYQTKVKNTQECNGATISVHILFKTLEMDDTVIFDISQEVFKAMQQVGFNRIAERPDYSDSEVIDWIITFEAPRWEDTSAEMNYISIPRPEVNIK